MRGVSRLISVYTIVYTHLYGKYPDLRSPTTCSVTSRS